MAHNHVYLDGKPIYCLDSEAKARSALEAEAKKLKSKNVRITPLADADTYLVTDLSKSSAVVLWWARGDGSDCPDRSSLHTSSPL
jgi:hypothetical protein